MADLQKLAESAMVALFTGGSAAATTLLGSWRDIKKRLKDLEDKVGTDEEPRTGLLLTVYQLKAQVKSTREMIDGWEHEPPEWMRRMLRSRPTSATGLGEFLAVEERINESLAGVRSRVAKVESAIQGGSDDLISREEYERDSRARADELAKIQRQLAESNGLLRGVMAALGFVENSPRK